MSFLSWSIGILLTAILLGMPHAPWTEANHALGGSSFDLMAKRFDKLVAQHPLPPIQRIVARDSAKLAVRVYKADKNQDYNVVLHHGTGGDSTCMHPLALGLQQRGLNVYVPDIRGHGESILNKPGDLDYKWQNLDDLEDLLKHFQLSRPVFVGYSSQGGGSWYLAAQDRWRRRFVGFVALVPVIGLSEELVHAPHYSNYAHANVPRLVALTLLSAIGITYFNHQSVMRFYYKAAKGVDDYEWQNTYSMLMSHAPLAGLSYETVLESIPPETAMLSISAGADECFADVTPLLRPLFPTGALITMPDATHVSILFNERVADRISKFVTGASNGPLS